MKAPWLLRMKWRQLCFAHWRVPVEQLSAALPPGCTPDTFEGKAWVSIVPFVMTDIRARAVPRLPGFARVIELNLRTYIRIAGRPTVWFFSLDASSPLMVSAARITTGLPYYDAALTLASDGAAHAITSARTHRGVPAGSFSATYHHEASSRSAAAASLEAFLHERYTFATLRGGRFFYGEVRHPPYQLHDAQIEIHENTLPELIGISLPPKPDRCYYADLDDVRASLGSASAGVRS